MQKSNLLPPANEVCEGYVLHVSVCPRVGGGLQAHSQGGGREIWLGGLQAPHLGGGVSRPTPRGSPGPHPGGSPGPHPGGYPSIHWGRPPPNRQLLLRVVYSQGGLRDLAGGSPGPTPGGSPGPHPGSLQAHTQGVSRITPGGGIPACSEALDPPNRRLLLWAVRILLECILVLISCLHDWVRGPFSFPPNSSTASNLGDLVEAGKVVLLKFIPRGLYWMVDFCWQYHQSWHQGSLYLLNTNSFSAINNTQISIFFMDKNVSSSRIALPPAAMAVSSCLCMSSPLCTRAHPPISHNSPERHEDAKTKTMQWLRVVHTNAPCHV